MDIACDVVEREMGQLYQWVLKRREQEEYDGKPAMEELLKVCDLLSPAFRNAHLVMKAKKEVMALHQASKIDEERSKQTAAMQVIRQYKEKVEDYFYRLLEDLAFYSRPERGNILVPEDMIAFAVAMHTLGAHMQEAGIVLPENYFQELGDPQALKEQFKQKKK